MEKTTLYLPTELHLALKEFSRRTGQPQAAVIREALQNHIAQQARPLPRSIGLGENEDVSAEESEAWLEAHWSPT